MHDGTRVPLATSQQRGQLLLYVHNYNFNVVHRLLIYDIFAKHQGDVWGLKCPSESRFVVQCVSRTVILFDLTARFPELCKPRNYRTTRTRTCCVPEGASVTS